MPRAKDYLEKRGYLIFKEEISRKIFILWFNRWTTSMHIARAYYRSNLTKGGDITNYYNVFKKLNYLDKSGTENYEACKIIKKKTINGIIKWFKSSRVCIRHRINLEPFFQYVKKERKTQLNAFDEYIINLIFSSKSARQKTINYIDKYPLSNVFDALLEIIFEYIVIPLKENKTQWTGKEITSKEGRISFHQEIDTFSHAFEIFNIRLRERIDFVTFKEICDDLKTKGKNNDEILSDLIEVIPNDFIKKMIKISMPEPLSDLLIKNYYRNTEMGSKETK